MHLCQSFDQKHNDFCLVQNVSKNLTDNVFHIIDND